MGGRCWWSWWAITDEGRRELRALHAEAWQEIRHRPDPVDLALAMSDDLDEDTLRGYLDDRRRAAYAVVEGVDLQGQPVVVAGNSELTRCLQHETDHLLGKLYIDRLAGPERQRIMRRAYESSM